MQLYFSIVIPLYNKQAHIERALNSVFNSVYAKARCDYEVIVIDDGSTDQSAQIVEQYQERHADKPLCLLRQSNRGVSAARNAGIKVARGRFVVFLDADDSHKSSFLNVMHDLTQQYSRAGMFSTAYQFTYANPALDRKAKIHYCNNDYDGIYHNYFEVACSGDLPVASSAVCIKRSVLNAIGGFPKNEAMGEDQSVWNEVALRYPVAYSRYIGADYHQESDNRLMDKMPPAKEMPFSERLQHYLEQGIVPAQTVPYIKRYIAGHLLDLVRRNHASHNFEVCHKLLSDKRTHIQPLRRLYWQTKVNSAVIIDAILNRYLSHA